ncbi:MAG: type II toxin-antitoxin system HipA family toxin [Acidobacteria bacterium]|nr:type II toxin-antitoxin system HipA family toxin [Acidobacteriota bacterium]
MTYRQLAYVEVWAWGTRVGVVAPDPRSGRYVFAFTPEWIASGVELSPLKMPLRETPYELGQWPELATNAFHGLVPLLADSLPDAFGNALVNAWMAEHGVARDSITPLDRLAYAADRAMGALEFRPPAEDAAREAPLAIALADLVRAARRTVRGELADDTGAPHTAIQQLIHVGSSAGGARAKAVITFNPVTYQLASAFVPREAGFEHWIIKLDGVSATGMDGHGDGLGESAPYGRIEYAYSLMATAAGVDMTPCRLLAEGPRRHFMTRRFDRDNDGGRIHVLSLAALAHLDQRLVGVHSYDQYLTAVTQLGLGLSSLEQAYRRMVFNVAAVNRDDHTKNFAFMRTRDGQWELAPAFDITHAYRASSEWTSRHNLRVNAKTEAITLDDLYVVGDRHEVPGFKSIVREVIETVGAWPEFAATADLDATALTLVAADLERFRPR